LPESIGNLQELTLLDIGYCDKLTYIVLPNSICFCKKLQTIIILNINMLPPSMLLLENLNDIQRLTYNGPEIQNINELRKLWYQMLKEPCK